MCQKNSNSRKVFRLLVVAIPVLITLVSLHQLKGLAAAPLQIEQNKMGMAVSSVASFTVNSTLDATDINPGDGICETGVGNGVCTLRAAIQESNALGGTDIILLASAIYTLTIPGLEEDAAATGDLDIADSVIIEGQDAANSIIDGGFLDRVFHVVTATNPISVTFRDVTIQHGELDEDANVVNASGGGILNESVNNQITIVDSVVQGNTAIGIGSQGRGGAIRNAGVLLVENTNLNQNTSPGGHAIHNSGILTLTNSEIAHNSVGMAGPGGSVFNVGYLFVSDTNFHHNDSYSGGGVTNFIMGTAFLTRVNITDNGNALEGGGIFNRGTLTVTHSTIMSNYVNTSNGGGIGHYDGRLVLQNVTLQNNTALGSSFRGKGGGLSIQGGEVLIQNSNFFSNTAYGEGGGLYNISGTVTIQDSTFSHNLSTNGGGGGLNNNNGGVVSISNTIFNHNDAQAGGAISSHEHLTLTNSHLHHNQANTTWPPYGGGGVSGHGFITITNTLIETNNAPFGGGVFWDSGVINLQNSIIRYNTTAEEGGGFANWTNSTANISHSAIYSNSTFLLGGGIINHGALSLTNSTVSHNTAIYGGGFYNDDDGSVTLNNITIGFNTSSSGIHNNGVISSANSIIAATQGTANCNGEIFSLGYNLSDDDSCDLMATGDISNTNPLLGPLQYNDEETLTHALLPGSPAIDAANPATPGTGNGACETTDQRSAMRPVDGDGDGDAVCDIGAFELLPMHLGKTGPTAVNAYDPITYTLILTNNLPLTLTNIIITDVVPAGATYISGGMHNGGVVSWTVDSLPADTSINQQFVVTATTTITNSQYRATSQEGYQVVGQTAVVTHVNNQTPIWMLYLSVILKD